MFAWSAQREQRFHQSLNALQKMLWWSGDAGKLLKIDSDAALYAEALAKIPDRASREAYMKKFCPKYFDMPALKAAISEKYQAIKKMEKAA